MITASNKTYFKYQIGQQKINSGHSYLLITFWLLGVFLTGFLASGNIAFIPATGPVGDMVKVSVHVFFLLVHIIIFGNRGMHDLFDYINNRWLLMFFGIHILSAIHGINPIFSLTFIAVLFLVFLNGYIVVRNYSSEQILKAFSLFSVISICTSLFIAFSVFQELHFRGDHLGTFNANKNAALAMVGGLMSFSIKNKRNRIFMFLLSILAIALNESRSALLGLILSVLIVWYLPYRKQTVKLIPVIFFIVSSLFLIEFFCNYDLTERVLHINDSERGLGSDFSGRLDPWMESCKQISLHPFLGNGPRTDAWDGRSSHNAFLSTIVEVGFIGFFITMSLFAYVWVKTRHTQKKEIIIMSTVVLSVFIRGAFEYEFINVITPMTVVMAMWLQSAFVLKGGFNS